MIVTHKNWLAKGFTEKLTDRVVKQDFGFDINPDTAWDTVWWAPGAWVASAYKAGVRLPLTSCGPRWLDSLSQTKYTGRTVSTMTVRESIDWFETIMGPGDEIEFFVKLPEAKLDDFPARTHLVNRHWATTIGQYHLPDDALIQLQGLVDFTTEWRFWVADGRITAHSLYRAHRMGMEMIWGSEGFPGGLDGDLAFNTELNDAADLVEKLLDDPAVAKPRGFVLDVGTTPSGQAWVVEANAAWSSGPYDASPQGVFESIVASHDWANESLFHWDPNPALYTKAGALRVTHV
ncbi:hypothetical protein KHO57_gp104 [Mycobacterium phage Phabba]|uniref:ATP-grasp domain-containing protein n=1 Tax=Mycobacterium phage Phabba TaxID=2027899 RepID=A0A249XT19_9CAUD|nr:hypothetical protein KHO57_gp104 [Mycobacterium phage Phabba]ASZ74800.1 hypothetical protein SEA_PHABBA_263 [Mycobacterium phage Phabba]